MEPVEAARVRVDPRAAADGVTQADLQEQLNLALELRDAMAEARALGAKLAAARQALRPDSRTPGPSRRSSIASSPPTLVYPQPMLIDQLSNVARMIGQADQRSAATRSSGSTT